MEEAWPGNPLGLNVRVPTPVRKGDAYRSGTHYRSKFDPTQAPTNSTIGLDGSTIPGITNITGTEMRSKVPVKAEGSFGKMLGSYKAEPSKFLLSHEKHPPLAFPRRFHYPDEVCFLCGAAACAAAFAEAFASPPTSQSHFISLRPTARSIIADSSLPDQNSAGRTTTATAFVRRSEATRSSSKAEPATGTKFFDQESSGLHRSGHTKKR